MKVTIDAGGREVTIETTADANLTPDSLGDTALRIWQATARPGSDGAGPGFGLQMERRERSAAPVRMGRGGMCDVKA
jgi:hypothetical protein